MLKFAFQVFVWLLLLAIGGAVGYSVAKLLRDDEHATVITVYQDWRLTCPPVGQRSCYADENLVDVRTGAVLARFSIAGARGQRDATITLPHNLLLPPGVALSVTTSRGWVTPARWR